MTDKMRRQILRMGAVGAAGLASANDFVARSAIATGKALANTQTPPVPETVTNPDGKFSDKVVLITGATSGIGEGTAYAFAREGAKVFFCGRRENLGRQVAAKIKGFGGEATYLRADVRREAEVKALVEACVSKYGRLDIAFNNAGILNPKFARLHEQPTTVMFLSSDEATAFHGSLVDVTSGMLD